jgi:predicted alpha/beta superfamily hydrolase
MGAWDAMGKALTGNGSERTTEFLLPRGTEAQFKFTLGSWDMEALLDDGTVPTNYVIEDLQENTALTFDIKRFGGRWDQPPPDLDDANLVGRADVLLNIASQHLDHDRHAIVWMPPGYDDEPARSRRYPVLYMHDGQNLFDPRSSATHVDWGVDETIGRLVADGKMEPIIVVGVFNTIDRQKEYSPWERGADYARFLAEELKPMIDAQYRTQRGPEATGVMGSSMGGLISLYLGWKHPDIFSRVGAISTHFPWNAGQIIRDIDATRDYSRSARVYFDFGTETLDATYEPFQQEMTAVFEAMGWKQPGDFVVYKAVGASHLESAWRARLHLPMMYLYGTEEARAEAVAIMRGEKPDPYAASAQAAAAVAPPSLGTTE